MEQRLSNASAGERSDHILKLALARDLQRLYAAPWTEPIPLRLRAYIEEIERVLDERHADQRRAA